MKNILKNRGALSTVVTTLIILVVSVLLAGVVTYFAINVVSTRVQEESLNLQYQHVWFSATDQMAEAAVMITNTGGRDVVLQTVAVRGQTVPTTDLFWFPVTTIGDLPYVSQNPNLIAGWAITGPHTATFPNGTVMTCPNGTNINYYWYANGTVVNYYNYPSGTVITYANGTAVTYPSGIVMTYPNATVITYPIGPVITYYTYPNAAVITYYNVTGTLIPDAVGTNTPLGNGYFNSTSGPITLKSGSTIAVYMAASTSFEPGSVTVNDVGVTISISIFTAQATYYKETNVNAAS
jgi:hypothetical protein